MGCSSSKSDLIIDQPKIISISPSKEKEDLQLKVSPKSNSNIISKPNIGKYSIIIDSEKSKKLQMTEIYPIMPGQIVFAYGTSIKRMENYQTNIQNKFTTDFKTLISNDSYSDSILWTTVKNDTKDNIGYIQLNHTWDYIARKLKKCSDLKSDDQIMKTQNLSPDEKNLYTKPTDYLCYNTEEFQSFLNQKNLFINENENEVEFCVRVSEEMKNIINYYHGKTFKNVMENIKDGSGDCGCHASIFNAILRANNIPCRCILGLFHDPTSLEEKIKNAGDYKSRGNLLSHMVLNYHMRCEVYFNGLGWVMVEPTMKSEGGIFLEDSQPFVTRYFSDEGGNLKSNQIINEKDISEILLYQCNFNINQSILNDMKYYSKKSLEDIDVSKKTKLIEKSKLFIKKTKEKKYNEIENIMSSRLYSYINQGVLNFTDIEIIDDINVEFFCEYDNVYIPAWLGNNFYEIKLMFYSGLISYINYYTKEASKELIDRFSKKYFDYYKRFIDRINQGLIEEEWNGKSSFKSIFNNNYQQFEGTLGNKNFEIQEIYILSNPSTIEAKLLSKDGPIVITISFNNDIINGIYISESGYIYNQNDNYKQSDLEKIKELIKAKEIYHHQSLDFDIVGDKIKPEQILYIKFE